MSTPIDPTNVAAILEQARAWAAPGETVHPVPIEHIAVTHDGPAALVDLAAQYVEHGEVVIVTDRTPKRRGDGSLYDVVEQAVARPLGARIVALPVEPGEPLHADLTTARRLVSGIHSADVVIAVGSGSVTDIVKYARDLCETGPRFISFPTAASVTAYTSALAVLLVDGAKRTLPASPPDAVVVDLPTLAAAPAAMTRAGFGDVLARSVSYGDWYLADRLGMADGFSAVPGRLLAGAEQRMIDQAEAVAASTPEGVRCVIDALLLAGMAMSLVNQTAPLSGWEHVISHFLDMSADAAGRPVALHGAQVGVATLVAARAYESAWPRLDLDALTREPTDADIDALRHDVEAAFGGDPALVAEVWRDVSTKMERWRGASEARRRFLDEHASGAIDAFLADAVRPADEVADALRRAGAPRRFEDLEPPVEASEARRAVRWAHLVRARFTLGDLLHWAGWLDGDSVEELLQT